MMENDKDIEKAMDAYNREIRKDHIGVEIEKNKFDNVYIKNFDNSLLELQNNTKINFFFNNDDILSFLINKEKIIVISSTQYPGYGGAATNAYKLIKYFTF